MKIVLYGLLLGAAVLPLASVNAVSFDAASIKPSSPDSTGTHSNRDGGYLRMANFTLKGCIVKAWGIREDRILNAVKWMDENRYDIVARSDSPPASMAEANAMLQSLLAERFHLALHHETRQVSGFSLTVTKGGIKAKLSAPGGRAEHYTGDKPGQMDATGFSMDRLAAKLSDFIGAPVVNATELQGLFDFSLNWSPEDMKDIKDAQLDAAAPWLPTALQEQLGLKLEPRKVPVDVLVIDHAESPSEN